MPRFIVAALLAFSSLVLPGCGLFGVGCGSPEAIVASLFNMCLLFSGDCCTAGEDGFLDCGELYDPFVYVCAGFKEEDHKGCTCYDPPFPTSPRQSIVAAATYDTPPVLEFDLGLPFAGMSSEHRVTFAVVAQSQQTYQGSVVYSPGFGFDGFTALGAPGTKIGSYGFDFDSNGVVDVALPLRALSAETAYVDINLDGQATIVDPTIQHVADVPQPGAHTFTMLLPAGGDMAPKITRAPRSFQVQMVLAAGILENPATADLYSVAGSFTSVDPDTGDASNGTGSSPQTLNVAPVPITIQTSPLELLDHFLCYKTKASKGNRCNDTATVNRGGLCVTDAECGGVGLSCGKNTFPKGVQVSLADQYTEFIARAADVKKPVRLCAPADKNDEGRHDTVTHLRGFQIKDAKNTPKRVTPLPLRIVNQLGTLAVQIKSPDTLYEPAAKGLGAPAPELGAHTVDRYQCYKAKALAKRCSKDPTRKCKKDGDCGSAGPCLGKFPKGLQVTLVDGFTAGKRFDVTKPTRLCSPALAHNDPIQSEDGHLMCYKVKPAANEAKHAPVVGSIHITSQLGRERLDTIVEDELCVPSLEL